MSRGPWTEHKKRDEIVAAALKLFLENGYEATSMKMIAEEAKCAVGLAYNYFATKDQLFDEALSIFVDSYKPKAEKIIEEGRGHAEDVLKMLFDYIKECVDDFREKYKNNLRWTTTLTISSHVLNTSLPYFKKAISMMIEDGMEKPIISLDVLASILNYGIGTIITSQTDEEYYACIGDIYVAIYMLLGQPKSAPEKILKYVEENKRIYGDK